MGCASSHHEAVNPRPNSARPPTPPPKIKAVIVFVVGPPASGKGTQCTLIKERFGYTHLSAGDLLREYINKGTALGQRVADVISSGSLVSDDLVLEILRDAIDSTQGPHRHFVIDGFPRTLSQSTAFERVIGVPTFVVSLNAPEAVLMKRIQGHKRVLEHVDDGYSAFKTRLGTFQAHTRLVLEHYRKAGLVHDIDANRHSDEVFADIAPFFEAQHTVEISRRISTSSRGSLSARALAAGAATTVVGADSRYSAPAPLPSTAPPIVFFIAPPAVGKGTLCAQLKKALGFHHLSTGQLLRAEVARGSDLGREVAEIMAHGDLVSDTVVLRLLRGAIDAANDDARGFVVDGFPDTMAQALAFEAAVCAPVFVVTLTASEAALEERVLLRARSSGRDDDNLETFRQRLAAYREHTQPVLDYYAKAGKLRVVDADRPVEAVFASVEPLFEGLAVSL